MSFRKTFWLIIFLFGMPILLGSGFYFLAPSFFSNSTVNYGQLIQPIITVKDNDIISEHQISGKWTLAYYTQNCDNECKTILTKIKTIHTLTNDKINRMQRLLLSDKKQLLNNSELIIAIASDDLIDKLTTFPKHSIFLIDPLKNIMMYYNGTELDSKKVLKDLNRLFKYSRIG